MTGSESTRPLGAEDIHNLLWMFDAAVGRVTDPGHVVRAAQSPHWWGSAEVGRTGDRISVTARLRHTGLPQVPPSELEQLGLMVLLQRGDQLCVKFQAVPGSSQVASATVSFTGALADLEGAALLITDDGRYCFEHLHCVGCGLGFKPGPDTADWEILVEDGPGGHTLFVCSPACEAKFAADHVPHPATHG